MFWARNTEFYEVSMCKDSCGLKRCACACLSGEQLSNWGFAPILCLSMWQQIWGQKSFSGCLLGAKVVGKKIFKARKKQLFGWIYSGEKSKPPTSNNRYMEIFSYWKDPFWIIIVRSSIQPSPLDTAVLQTLMIDKDSSRSLQLSICYKCIKGFLFAHLCHLVKAIKLSSGVCLA